MKIPLPKTTADLRIRHFNSIREDKFNEELSIMDKVDFLSTFTGEKKSKLMMVNANDINQMYEHCEGILSVMHIGTPLKEITLNGKSFTRVDPEKVGVGWHADFSKADIAKDPVWLACLFYFPTGELYGAVDENDNLLNPIKDRYNTIQDFMTLETFLSASAFFLTCAEKSMRKSTLQNQATEKVVKALSRIGMRGKKSLIS